MNLWIAFGLFGQILFGLRFIIQWICSERKKQSYIPLVFWYLSISGGIILLAYAIYRKDPVFILGQSTGLFVYVRNLILIAQHKKKLQPTFNEENS
ncbi:MAG: lipid-A-disaccharide synthase N-terminal domain-containing protein [Candidatus Omnitrophota bacterium]